MSLPSTSGQNGHKMPLKARSNLLPWGGPVNYKLAPAMGNCHLPLQGLNHVLLQLLIANTPWKELRVESRSEAGCWQDWFWSWNSNILATQCKELTYFKRPWWERLRAEGEGGDRGWDDWMASLTQWTWVWVNSRSRWWIGRPGVLWFMVSKRVRHDWVAELKLTEGIPDM